MYLFKYEGVIRSKIISYKFDDNPYLYKTFCEIFVKNKKVCEFLKNYASNLGSTDASSQIDYLNERKAYIKKHKDESFADYKKYSSLYVKIFLMLGVLIAVLLA